MFSGKVTCPSCSSKLKDSFDFCPHCGTDIRNPQRELEDFGLLGKHESASITGPAGPSMGLTDKLIASMINSIMKNLEKQMRGSGVEMHNLPNGISISVGQQPPKAKKQKLPSITQEHVERMRGLPRVEPPLSVRRLGDKVIYELKAPGVASVNDVFVSKLASGYEVRAIGKKKVYLSSLPVELPLKSYTVEKEGLILEFSSQ